MLRRSSLCIALLALQLLGCRPSSTSTREDTAVQSLKETTFSHEYTSAFWDAERTKHSPRWVQARAYCHSPLHRLAPNCRIVNALVAEADPAEDEEAVALVREALRSHDQLREQQAWEALGFGGVMRPEPRASASPRWEPAPRDSVHAPRE